MKKKYHKRLRKILEEKWGFSELKPKQMEIIEAIVDQKRDVVGLLPTGYGKSMTFLIPPLITRKVCIIISPLISLMEDQKEKLIERDIPVAALHGNNFNKDKEIFQIIDNEIHIVYMSPEFLINGDGFELATTLQNDNMLGLFAIDEAHCTSVWGHDFRNDYLKLGQFREKFPSIPILTVTATATFQVVQDIVDYIKLKEPLLVRADFDRPNLFLRMYKHSKFLLFEIYHKKYVDNKDKRVLDYYIEENTSYDGDREPIYDLIENYDEKGYSKKVEKFINDYQNHIDVCLVQEYIKKYITEENNDRIIIYTNSRKETIDLNEEINKKWKKMSVAYHAGMSKKMRSIIQEKFSSGEVKVIVSTIAFGMGIDQTVRCVLIFGAPSSIEDYYQQIGRAGRDNNKAETVLFFQYQKIAIAQEYLHKYKNPKVREAKRKNYMSISRLVYGIKTCRRKFVLEYFGQVPKFFNCHNCDNCLELNKDITKKMYKFLINNKDFFETFKKNKDIKKLTDLNLVNVYNKDKKVSLNLDLINWKKIMLANEVTIENMKDKYRIYI
tara:strand:+ start:1227 stop:2885 length:1659 start_codon:yes stop_codon:yes gene_type:complete